MPANSSATAGSGEDGAAPALIDSEVFGGTRLPPRSRRALALGVAVSLLLHLLLVGGLPSFLAPPPLPDHLEVTLPPARFSTMPPVPPSKPLPPRHARAGPRAAPSAASAAVQRRPALPAEPLPQADPLPPPDDSDLLAAAGVPAGPPGAAGEAAAGRSGNAAERVAATGEGSAAAAAPALPAEGEIDYETTFGTGDHEVGHATLHWTLDHGRYRVDLLASTSGLARLLKWYPVRFRAEGLLAQGDLRPERYAVLGMTSRDSEESARFDWDTGTLVLAPSGSTLALPARTQDFLTFFFQFAFKPPSDDGLTRPVTNGRKIDRYAYELTDRTRIKVPLGEIETVHISRLHALNENALEIWLAQDRHYLPVQLRMYARGNVINLYATGIRASDAGGP